MRHLALLALASTVFAVEYTPGTVLALDTDARTVRINNRGPQGGYRLIDIPLRSADGERKAKVWLEYMSIVDPESARGGSTSSCADPCQIEMNLQVGSISYYYEKLDISGNPFSPARISRRMAVPMIDYPASSTLSVPVYMHGTEDYRYSHTFTLASVPTSPGIYLRLTGLDISRMGAIQLNDKTKHYVQEYKVSSAGHTTTAATVSTTEAHGLTVGDSVWMLGFGAVWCGGVMNGQKTVASTPNSTQFTFAVTSAENNPVSSESCLIGGGEINRIERAYTKGIDWIGVERIYGGIGGGPDTYDIIVHVPSSDLVVGENKITFHFAGTLTGGRVGYYVLEWNVVDRGSETRLDQWVVSGSTATVRSTDNHNLSTGDWVMIKRAPGPYGRFNGYRQVTVTDATHFTYSIDTASFPTSAGTYTLPTSTHEWAPQPTSSMWEVSIPSTSFVRDNPATWTAGTGNASTGQTLFDTHAMRTRSPYFNFAASSAKCGKCHFRDGSDFKIFNYPKWVVKTSAMLRGFTDTEADDLWAYLHSLPVSRPANGAPWNPARQPGPGLDSGTTAEWLAGAGQEWVLQYDSDMREYMEAERVAGRTDWKQFMKRRELPIAVQLLNWKHWLPALWPGDMYSDYDSSSTWQSYINDIVPVASTLSAYQTSNWLELYSGGWMRDQQPYLHNPDMVRGAPYVYSSSVGSWSNPVQDRAIYDTRLAFQVKVTEQHWMKGFEEFIGDAYESGSIDSVPDAARSEARGLLGGTSFNTAPHKLHTNGRGMKFGFTYLTWAWYWIQWIEDVGSGVAIGQYPLDWAYQNPGFIKQMTQMFGPNGFMLIASQIGGAQGMSDHATWNETVYGPIKSAVSPLAWNWGSTHEIAYQQMTDSEKVVWLGEALKAWNDYLENWTEANWQAVPGACPSGDVSEIDDTICGMNARTIPILKHLGVADSEVQRLRDRSAEIWPARNWTNDYSATCWTRTWNGKTWPFCSNQQDWFEEP